MSRFLAIQRAVSRAAWSNPGLRSVNNIQSSRYIAYSSPNTMQWNIKRGFSSEGGEGDDYVSPLVNTTTHQNLKTAFATKAMSALRYEYYAQKADAEGYLEAARLFRSMAASATQQAFGHFEFLEECGDPATDTPVGDVLTNLAGAASSETSEADQMYPRWSQKAAEEGFDDVADWFETLSATSSRNATAAIQLRQDLEAEDE
mmetsp:Transcript_286/g.504  ORF Transcript_286/g.504 Transcript_286/m.504 type:complete len:203 (+) Transcript_286:50-658(+)|eukprot:CAMPEP_0184692876 /NCGR_PEP_ID=MMETSP0313-20130426/1205_1 /TAXON_ID=2792 /ORGANISM="Porphyridium aerugineum, Strain SAG 1380-2" /LENGTH=202 /DNA_ID=CAMNT_0027150773 /DNA_START=50 /DNA_END=658 /DNA_ORIENTATION=-